MKISFRGDNKLQQPVIQTQTEMKNHRAHKTPVFKMMVVFLILMAVLFLCISLYKKNVLYTYGIVSGDTEEVKAVFPAQIGTLYVKKGEVVKKGDLLFNQLSMDGTTLIKAAEGDLNAQLAEYNFLIKSGGVPGENETTPEYTDSVTSEIELLKLKQKDAAITRERFVSDAKYERTRLETLYSAINVRHGNLLKLYQLDAVTRSQVLSAETEKDLRFNELNRARRNYNQVIELNQLARTREREEIRKLQATRLRESVKRATDLETLLIGISTARLQLAHLNKKYGATDHRARFDSIITDVNVSNGSIIDKGAPILTSVSLERLWVDVYVEAQKADMFTKDRKISIFAEGHKRSIVGKLSERGKVQLRVPPLLSGKIPDVASAVYFNVSFENNGQMLPGNIVKVIVKY
jgi:multidrug resistance efflux pump